MVTRETIFQQINDIFGEDMHAKRVASLANATHGVIESGALAIVLLTVPSNLPKSTHK